MNWLGVVMMAVGLYLALKVAGTALKLLMWAMVLVGAYLFASPLLGLPAPF
ncbi:hypothetical protein [Cognatiluteimonas weifangensis]|uniref:hypothetical protein n=1 Tax=Cognatiluteimonas weifangensis TaxID=2303539 RepID=UPI00131424FF|nr:hypothetical protein [Luteimonas weifangensis]